jgi:integrase
MKTRAGSACKYTTKTGERLWRYRFDADPVDGKRRQVSLAGFATRGAAVKACGDAIREYEKSKSLPTPPPPTKETVADWVRAWLRDYAPHQCQPKTLERYHQLAGYILDAADGARAILAQTPLAELKHTAVEAAIYELLRMPAKRRAHLSPKTVREIASVLGVALNEAFRLDKILVNPLLKVRLPKAQRTEAKALAPEQMQRLYDACRGDWTFTFIETALATGARRGELLALEWPDVDWLTATVMISKSIEQTAAGLRVKRPKNGKVRKFRVGPRAIAALRFRQEQQAEPRRLLGSEYKGDLVFCEADGAMLRPDLVSQTIVRRLRKAGVTDASLHTLRHTLASHLLANHVPLPAVSARLGHADVNITARIYSHMLPDDDARAADAWETVIRPIQ